MVESSLTRTIVIVDDEPTTFAITTTNFRVDEDVTAGKIDINYTLTPASPYDVTFIVYTQDDTAVKGEDYTEIARQTVTITAGTTSGTISIPILNDNDTEGEQSFTLNIENIVGAVIAGDIESIEQTITIVDDEAQTIILDDILSAENIIEGYGAYNMSLSTPTAVSSSVFFNFSTTALTATSGTDYTAPANQTFRIINGDNESSLSGFQILNNSTQDGDKTFRIDLSITSGGAVFLGGATTKQITMTIIDDESLVVTTSRSEPQEVDEEVGEVFVYYSLARSISSPITFDLSLSDGVQGGFQLPGEDAKLLLDYGSDQTSRVTRITLPAGETSGSFAIPIIDDAVAEFREGFTVTFNNITNAVFDDCDVTDIRCSPRESQFAFFINEKR